MINAFMAIASLVLATFGATSFGTSAHGAKMHANTISATPPPVVYPTPVPTPLIGVHTRGPVNGGGAGGGHETCPAGWYVTAEGNCEIVYAN